MLVFVIIISITHILCHRVVWITLNGISFDEIVNGKLTVLKKYLSKGAYSSKLTSDFTKNYLSNHYSMSTGYFPSYHGVLMPNLIINGSHYLHNNEETASLNQVSSFKDIRPIWTLNKQYNNKISLCICWPGCYQKNITKRYTMFVPEDSFLNTSTRLLITRQHILNSPGVNLFLLRLSEIENTASTNSYQSPKFQNSLVFHNNQLLKFFTNLEHSPEKINFLITSNYEVPNKEDVKIVNIRQFTNVSFDNIYVSREGSHLVLYINENSIVEQLILDLSALKDIKLKIYTQQNIPKTFFYSKDNRNPQIVVVADGNHCLYVINKLTCRYASENNKKLTRQSNGFLIAFGPDINTNVELGNINTPDVYLLICNLLRITNCEKRSAIQGNIVSALVLKHPIFSDTPLAKITIFVALIVALLFTSLAFIYTYCNKITVELIRKKLKIIKNQLKNEPV